jgi:hypothetical protein
MAATFTTWQALYLVMLDSAAEFYSGQLSVAEYTVNSGSGSRHLRYRTEAEFRAGLEFVHKQAQAEASGLTATSFVAPVCRTYAKNSGGRGL